MLGPGKIPEGGARGTETINVSENGAGEEDVPTLVRLYTIATSGVAILSGRPLQRRDPADRSPYMAASAVPVSSGCLPEENGMEAKTTDTYLARAFSGAKQTEGTRSQVIDLERDIIGRNWKGGRQEVSTVCKKW